MSVSAARTRFEAGLAASADLAAMPPLCVDLDGTLTPVDTLHENLIALVRHAPRSLFSVPFWLHRGKAQMKREIAVRAKFTASSLPINQQLLAWLETERASGRAIILATAADLEIAEQVARHVGLFDNVIASDGKINLSGEAKRRALVERFGERGFDYVGNKKQIESVWRSARKAIVVGTTREVELTRQIAQVDRVFALPAPDLKLWVKALRLHQWAKNVLIFLPALLAHLILQPDIMIVSVLAWLAFGLCASSVYIVNDLLDLAADRNHPRKCSRAFASGQLSVCSGLAAATILIASSSLLAMFVGWKFSAILAGYYLLTWSYSLRLKRAAIVDVMTLAGLYTIRIIAGAAATAISLSFWLLAFSMFIFLSLSFVKRYTELDEARKSNEGSSRRRGYDAADLPLLLSLGVTSGFSTIVVMALYIDSTSSQVLYRHPKPLWLICPLLLYWISRVWLLTTRGQMPDDPVVFALRDRISLVVAVLLGFIVVISI